MGKAARREARERLKQQRLKEQQKAKRNRVLLVVGAAVVVVALVVAVGYFVVMRDRGGGDVELPPQALQTDGSVVLADTGANAPVLEIYADYQCPACKQFETATGSALEEMAAEGEVIVHYRPVSIFALRGEPLGSNSLRGGAAARAAADAGRFVEYNDVLFENQPAEGDPGFSPDELKQWGEDVGIDDPAFAERVDAESQVADRFAQEYAPELLEKAQGELGADSINTMPVTDLIAWGDENGVDSSFLDDTYVREILESTGAVNERYDGENAFEGTPSVYLNGAKMGNEMYSASSLRSAVAEAEPGEPQSTPADGAESGADGEGSGGDAGATPSTSPSADAKE